MKFVSYAQNYEDVMLRRALAKVDRGFYIDVGAAEPYADSVTAAFYERGWRGINIEPMPGPFERLTQARPQDVNLQVAVENKQTVARYFAVDGGNGISTGIQRLAEGYRNANWDITQVTVAVTTLRDICETYVGERPVHFLKIDVEGNEREVLASADFNTFRPWIILVEATEPNSQIPSHDGWEAILLEAKYNFVYFDGLNRFYVSAEKMDELKQAFLAPPNWFDGFIRASESDMIRHAMDLERQLVESQKQLQEAHKGWSLEKGAREELEMRLNSAYQNMADQQVHDEQPSQVVLEDASRDCVVKIRAISHEEIDQLKARLAASEGDLENYRAQLAELHVRLTESEKSGQVLSAERDAAYQELFESSRHAAWLSQERGRLQGRVDELEHMIGTLRLRDERVSAALHAVLQSTSWKLTGPLRCIKRMMQRRF
ncbi:FkbM family methyltransferase [Burkholderia ubonensis]|uniref:FkbM family methyltransferase n=1 Tax=Burkholderia ubonensis TaxID=101571 RepID=UPI000752DE03|nr:FkbM family methyltransferase [Burkholderia ubonensis]KWC17678.1 FkbM family methyltransferase [Burkholderia ubonensis]KWC29095.1 FkbM family methyltransferase [Burkholderia ubonensis]KWO02585.1 FkbM family methyltransferase [Burkholderia ubonensis]